MNKKIISFLIIFALVAAFVCFGITKIEAAKTTETIKVSKVDSDFTIYYASGKKGYATPRYVTSNNKAFSGSQPAYCLQLGTLGPVKGDTLEFKNEHKTGPVAYILNQGKNTKITQKAIWIHLHKTDPKLYPKTLGSKTADYSTAKSLADKAYKDGQKYNPVPTMTLNVTSGKSIGEIAKGSDGYYTSKTITVATKDGAGNAFPYKISLKGAPANTRIMSGNKVIGLNTLTSVKSFVVRVPVKEVKKDTNITVTLTSNSLTYYTWKSYKIKDKQDLGVPIPHNSTVTQNFSATVKRKTCHKVGNTYYGKDGFSVSEETFNKSCTTACKQNPVTKKYLGKDGVVYSSNTAAGFVASCGTVCTKDSKSGYYIYSKSGKKVATKDAAIYIKESGCVSACAKDKITGLYVYKDGSTFKSAGTNPSSNKDYLKVCHNCQNKAPLNNIYYDNSGNAHNSLQELENACKTVCTKDESTGIYYGSDGNPVKDNSVKEFNLQCYGPCTVTPDGKYIDLDGNDNKENYYKQCPQKSCAVITAGNTTYYYNSNGKSVSESEYNSDPVCAKNCVISDNKYYVKNKVVSFEEYDKACNNTVLPVGEPVKSVDTYLVRYEKDYHYTIKHEVPYRSSSAKFKSYTFKDTLEEPLQVKSAKDVKITQHDTATGKDTDYTDKFTVHVDGQNVTATLKDEYNNSSFYGTRVEKTNNSDGSSYEEKNKVYSFVLTASLKNEAESKYNMDKYKKDDTYIIPDVANISYIEADGDKTISLDTNKVEVAYKLQPNPSKMVSGFDQTSSYEKGTSYAYSISYQVLDYTGNQRYSKFVVEDEFEDAINIDSKKSVVIKNEEGKDVTSWFDIDLKDQKLSMKLKDSHNNDDFYGHIYDFTVSVNLKQGYNLKKYIKDNKYVIPNYATVNTGDKNVKTNVVDVTVKLTAKSKVKTPNTASPIQIAAIAAGIAIIISGVYSILGKYNLLPLKK